MNKKSMLIIMRFPGGSVAKYPPAIQEMQTRVWSVGLEDPLEKDMANHSSILAYYHMKL